MIEIVAKPKTWKEFSCNDWPHFLATFMEFKVELKTISQDLTKCKTNIARLQGGMGIIILLLAVVIGIILTG